MTTVLPATSAAAAGAPSSAYGKFQGAMTAHTPYGRSTLVFVSVGTSRPISRDVAGVLAHLLRVVRVEVGGLFDLAQRLDAVLPHLEDQPRRQLEAALRTMSAARSRIAARSCQGTALQRRERGARCRDGVVARRRRSRSRRARRRRACPSGCGSRSARRRRASRPPRAADSRGRARRARRRSPRRTRRRAPGRRR